MIRSVYTIFVVQALALLSCDCGVEQPDAAMFTGRSEVYALHSVSDPALEVIIKFAERRDSVTLIAIYLKGTKNGNSHPAFIHANSIEETGEVLISLKPVNGKNGISETMVNQKNDGTRVNYDDLLGLNGHIRVHMSHSNMKTVLMLGNIDD